MGCFGSKEKPKNETNNQTATRTINLDQLPVPPIPSDSNPRSGKSTVGRKAGANSELGVNRTKSTGKSTVGRAGGKSTVGRTGGKSTVGRAGGKSTVGRAGGKSTVGTSGRSAGKKIKLPADSPGVPIGNFDMVFGSVGELSSAIFGAVKTLYDNGDIKVFPKSNIRQGGIGSDWKAEVKLESYEEIFKRDQRGKIIAIAAVVSMFLWDSIQDYRFFDEPAIKALKAAQELHNEPDIPPHIAKNIQLHKDKVKSETDALVADLGVKSTMSKDVLRKLVELSSRVAIQLKKYPGEVYLTYNPSINFTPFARRKAACQVVYYWISKDAGVETEFNMRSNGAIKKPSPGTLLYFPEILLKMKQRSGSDTCIIRQAEYG